MKKIISAVLLSAFLSSCPSVGPNPGQEAYYQALLEREQSAELAVQRAALTPEPEDDVAAAEELARVKEEFSDLEAQILRERAGPIVSLFSSFLGPWGATLSPLILGLVPLVGPRGRKHYKRVLSNLIPGIKGDDGSRGISPVAAGESLLKAFGALHSSKASQEAADAT